MRKSVCCLGDSNTWGFDPRSPLGDRFEEPYPELLSRLLSCPVSNLGINGLSAEDVCRSYPLFRNRIQSADPDTLVILLGTNDILMGDSEDPAPAARQLEQLAKKLREDFPFLDMVLISPPLIRLPGPCSQAAQDFSRHCEAIAGKVRARYLNPGSLPLCQDGVHLTQEGHRLLAQALAEIL